MIGKLLKHRYALVAETLLAAGLLFALGYETAGRMAASKVESYQKRAVIEAERAAALAQDNARLEQRLGLALAEAGQGRPPSPAQPAPTPPPLADRTGYRVLHADRADLLLGGRLVVTLEEVIGGRPRVAVLRLKVAGGQEGRKALKAGQGVRIRVAGKVYHLLVKQIHTASVRYGLLPE